MIRLGVTGTDTGVGKSVVTAAVVAMLRARGLRVAAMKPAETGLAADDAGSDAALLRAAAGGADALDLVRPVLLAEPLAPWVAAARAGTAVDPARLDDAFALLSAGRDAVVVEGAGGLLVPLTREMSFDALFARWELDVLVVAGNRLGVVNHARLTVAAARAAGLRVRGVVLNEIAPADPGDLARETNLATLRELLTPTPVVPFPHIPAARDPASLPALASLAAAAGLADLLDLPPHGEG
jgi:dethiobiotin synthetase